MIFGFGKKNGDSRKADEEDEEQEELDYVLFQGATNGREANLGTNARSPSASRPDSHQGTRDRCSCRRADQLADRACWDLLADAAFDRRYRLSRQPFDEAAGPRRYANDEAACRARHPSSTEGPSRWTAGRAAGYQIRTLGDQAALVGQGAERLTVKIRNLASAPKTAEDVGFSKELKQRVREITSEKKGIILACGGPGSGVSTTDLCDRVLCRRVPIHDLSSIGDLQGARDSRMSARFDKSEGDPPPYSPRPGDSLRGGRDLWDLLRDGWRRGGVAVLKWQPDVCFISEFPAADALNGIAQFAKLVGNAKAAEGLRAVMSQRLIRLLCNKCKLAYRPNPKILTKIGLPPETKTLSGCVRPVSRWRQARFSRTRRPPSPAKPVAEPAILADRRFSSWPK